jgi:predicted metal-dependent hydrolase
MDNLELTTYAQSIADDIISRRKARAVRLSVKDIKQGHAYFATRHATIPNWAYTYYGLEHFTYYVIHEVCHFISSSKHDADFKRTERRELKLWGMEIQYLRAYPQRLTANGKTCYEYQKRTADDGSHR